MASTKIRPGGTCKEFSFIVKQAAKEFGWLLSPNDYPVFDKSFSPSNWCWVAENEKNEIPGMILAVEHGSEAGHIGCFFVRPDHRGKGICKPLFQKALQCLEGRNISLATGKSKSSLTSGSGWSKPVAKGCWRGENYRNHRKKLAFSFRTTQCANL